jgi:hypothetical protein
MNQPNEPVTHRAARTDPASTISSDIEQALERRTAPADTWQARVEEEVKHDCIRVWHALQRRPAIGVVAFAGAAMLAGSAFGVGEVALAVAMGYGAYRVLRKGRSAIAKPSGEAAEHT